MSEGELKKRILQKTGVDRKISDCYIFEILDEAKKELDEKLKEADEYEKSVHEHYGGTRVFVYDDWVKKWLGEQK